MKTLLLTILFLAPALYARQAPTVGQCRADGTLWSAGLDPDSQGFLSRFDTPALDAMSEEMVHCEDVDPRTYEQYGRVTAAIGIEIRNRLEHFIGRQGLTDKFFKEDAAGAR